MVPDGRGKHRVSSVPFPIVDRVTGERKKSCSRFSGQKQCIPSVMLQLREITRAGWNKPAALCKVFSNVYRKLKLVKRAMGSNRAILQRGAARLVSQVSVKPSRVKEGSQLQIPLCILSN